MNRLMRAAIAFGGAILYLGLSVLASGGFKAFIAHPPLIAVASVFIGLSLIAVFAGGNLSPGVREDRSNRWVLAFVSVIGLAAAFVPAWSDRLGFWTIDGDAVRWLGVALIAIGGALRIVPIFVLGSRFSGLVAIQPGHTLMTSGLYGQIRHPSYLGLLTASLGWGLAFRSILGVVLALLLIPPILARIESEERLLHSQFGSEYERYRAKTFRLIPGIY
ncbi:MAG: isoprenylcysteine carboxylmethyltransferase family protein [Candidatus Eremiobacteraeota bacterium]|nr:isoprenylcysteine carboxylmethyltransferase family protein [Candidatus Eremiobacteraeota bacterium]